MFTRSALALILVSVVMATAQPSLVVSAPPAIALAAGMVGVLLLVVVVAALSALGEFSLPRPLSGALSRRFAVDVDSTKPDPFGSSPRSVSSSRAALTYL